MIVKFVFKGFRRESIRLVVALLGVGAATGLIVWSLGLAITASRQSQMQAAGMCRPFSVWVNTGEPLFTRWRRGAAPLKPPRAVVPPHLDQRLLDAINDLPQVRRSQAYRVRSVTIDYRPDGRVMQGPPMSAVVALARPEGSPYTQSTLNGTWPDPDDPAPLAAVCTSIFSPRRLTPPPLGSTLVLLTPQGTLNLTIAAYIDYPQIAAGFPTIFTTKAAITQLFGADAVTTPPNLLLCETRGADSANAAIEAAITASETEYGPLAGADLISSRALASGLVSDALMNFKRQAPLLLTLAVLTAFCMLFNAITIGIEQRLRIFGLLRTVGMTAGQVARLVALEGALIALIGWVVGLAGGTLLLWRFTKRAAETFPAGMALGWITPAATAGGVALITLITLYWACRRALRIHPLDYLPEDRNEERPIRPARATLGILLLFPMLLLALPLPITPKLRSFLIILLGLPLHGLGLYLSLPLFVRTLERLVVPPLARLLRLDPSLLRRRSSRHYPRTAGMILTLTVGLGSFSAIHIWGSSLMSPFTPSKEFPDVIVSILPNGIEGDAAGAVAALEGVAHHNCLAIEAAQFNTTSNLTERIAAIEGKPAAFSNALLLGVKPLPAFGGDQPLADFHFNAGDRHTAAAALEAGGACIVTRMFSRATRLGLGDELTLETARPQRRGGPPGGRPSATGKPPPAPRAASGQPATVAYRIVGVVDLNWHLVTSRANLRGRHNMGYGTLGPVFVNEREVRELTGNQEKTYYLWANLSDSWRALGPLPAGQKLEAEIRRVLAVDEANTVRVHHRDEIADGTIAHGNHLIGDMARAPFWSLIVLATGIVTLLVATVRASARELAIMRMVGMTRSQLGRLLLGEALTATIGGIVLSLISGICIGWTFTGWTRASMPFGGLPLTLTIPWRLLLRGTLFALFLTGLMALPPIAWLVNRGLPTSNE